MDHFCANGCQNLQVIVYFQVMIKELFWNILFFVIFEVLPVVTASPSRLIELHSITSLKLVFFILLFLTWIYKCKERSIHFYVWHVEWRKLNTVTVFHLHVCMYVTRTLNFCIIIGLLKQIHPTIKTLHPHLLNQKLEPPAGVIRFANGGFTLHLVTSLLVNLIFTAFTHAFFE
jgi:hypothetical protein